MNGSITAIIAIIKNVLIYFFIALPPIIPEGHAFTVMLYRNERAKNVNGK